jgi:hypothetical protein
MYICIFFTIFSIKCLRKLNKLKLLVYYKIQSTRTMMILKCNLCQNEFKKKQSLQVHLNEKRCKSELLQNLHKLHEYIEQLKNNQHQTINQSIIGGDHNTYINVKIEINPITKLDISHIEPEKMKHLIEKYDDVTPKNPEKLNLLLTDYIKDVICDKEHPENHAVKYIKKKPPTYNCFIEDTEGNTVTVIKGLKDTCEVLSDPMLNTLKTKLKEFLQKYKEDEEFDYSLYEDAIKQLRKELNKGAVKKALSSVLQNDILNNIQMKLNISANKS